MLKFFLLLLVIFVTGCAPTRFVKPLDKEQKVINASFGGPLIGFAGMTIPVPLTSLTGGYGLKEDLTIFGSLHTTALLFGVIQTEFGVVKSFLTPDKFKPGLTVTPVINLAIDKWKGNFKLWPQLDINAYWNYKDKDNYFYLGSSNWFELAGKKAHEEKQTTLWIGNFHAGHTFVRGKMDYNLEFKYLAPFFSNQDVVVDYKSFGNNGAIGVYMSVTKKF